MEIVFADPRYLFFLLFVPIVIVAHFIVLRVLKKKAVIFANFETLSRVSRKYLPTQNNQQLFIRVIAIILVVFALAEMQLIIPSDTLTPDTAILIDASASMQGEPFAQAQDIASSYVANAHPLAQIGVMTFSTISRVQVQPTRVRASVIDAIGRAQPHEITGTDLGTAILNGLNLVEPFEGDRHMLIISDGRTVLGSSISAALEDAAARGVTIDPVLIVEPGQEQYSYAIEAMDLIANVTEGRLLYADDPELTDKLVRYYPSHAHVDLYDYLLILALIIITLEWILSKSIYKTVPND